MVGNGIHRASDFSVKWLRTDGCTMLTPAEPTRHGVTSWYRPDDCERVIEVIPTGGGSTPADRERDGETHGEGTLHTVYGALIRAGVTRLQAADAISEMQNAGILFRERQS